MTIRELFTFAGKIRLALSDEEIEERVDTIVSVLGLAACENTLVGGWLIKGVSGGERKRASIGYELITEPSLLLLDEPTSGLDSSTSFRIVELLKKQASRGMSVMCTIHQPSAKIFHLFDRVILLSEGYTIYNGPPAGVKDYFSSFGLQMSRYVNPADKLSIIAASPRYLLKQDTTVLNMHQECKLQ